MNSNANDFSDLSTRPCDASLLMRQIGGMNLMAISGGRWSLIEDTNHDAIGIRLPISHGKHVEVFYMADDTYMVRRVFIRSGKRTIQEQYDDVYCEQVSEMSYQASCWR
jgi:hypothetical protein